MAQESWHLSKSVPATFVLAIAVQTVKAELDETPAAGGTIESISIFIPLGFSTS